MKTGEIGVWLKVLYGNIRSVAAYPSPHGKQYVDVKTPKLSTLIFLFMGKLNEVYSYRNLIDMVCPCFFFFFFFSYELRLR